MTVGEPGAAWADGVGLDAATAAFVRDHRDDDVRELALHARRGDGVDLPLALDQIAGRRTAVRKLPTWAACEDVVYPPHLSMEQCSSEATARYKARLAGRLLSSGTADGRPGARTSLLDLTGGFGVDFSFMARVFDEATYVERDPRRPGAGGCARRLRERRGPSGRLRVRRVRRSGGDAGLPGSGAARRPGCAHVRGVRLHAGCARPPARPAGRLSACHGQALPHARLAQCGGGFRRACARGAYRVRGQRVQGAAARPGAGAL